MGELSPIHWVIVLAIVVLLFGGRKIPELMRGLGEGVRSFKEGMREEPGSAPSSTVASQTSTAAPVVAPDNNKK